MSYEAISLTMQSRKSQIVNRKSLTAQGKGQKMSTYTVVELLQQWKLGDLTAEQAMGYLLQQLVLWEPRLVALEKRLPPVEPARPVKS